MTREEALKNLVKCVFGKHTLSAKDGYIIPTNSVISNCNYTTNSFKNIKELFETALLNQNPQYNLNSGFEPFDKEAAVTNAVKYLERRGIHIPESLPLDEMIKLIFDILVNKYLFFIVIKKDDDDAKLSDISQELLEFQERTAREFSLTNSIIDFNTFLNKHRKAIEIESSENAVHDEKHMFSDSIDCLAFSSYRTLMLIRDFSTLLPQPLKSDNEIPSYYKRKLLSSIIPDSSYESYPVFFFHDENVLFKEIIWISYLCEKDVFVDPKQYSLIHNIKEYHNKIKSRAKEKAESYLNDELKPFFENNRIQLESLISAILKLSFSKLKYDEKGFLLNLVDNHKLLFKDCEEVFFDFERIYLTIEKEYNSNTSLGMYITLQNLIIELTSLLDDNATEIAKWFKSELSKESFSKHKRRIKKAYTSDKLEQLIELEKKLSKKYSYLFSEPCSVNDYFNSIKKKVFYNFQSSLYRYYECLSDKSL